MRIVVSLIMLGVLAACGADGEPIMPTRDATVSISNHGVSAHTSVGVRQGPVSVSVGLGL